MNKSAKVWMPIAALSLFAVFLIVKNIFVGLETDEQYPVALAYKILSGKTLLKDCFEIHQTSALFPALLLGIKGLFTDTSFDIIYIRICSAILLGITGFCVWKVAKEKVERPLAFLIAVFFATYLPKFYLTMDYALLQYIFLTLMMCMFIKNKELDYKEWKNTDYIIFGILSGLLTFAYPPFIVYPLLLCICFKKQSWKVLISALPTAGLFLIAKGGIDVTSIKNIFSDASHHVSLMSKVKALPPSMWQIAVIVVFFLLIATTAKKEKEVINISVFFLAVTVILTIAEAVIKEHKAGYNGSWLLILAILLIFSESLPVYVTLGASIPIMQFLSGNQTGFLFARYIIPFLLPLLLQKDLPKAIRQKTVYTIILLSLIPLVNTTANFQNETESLVKMQTGPAKGIYIDKMTDEKVKEVFDYYKDKDPDKTLLVMDSSAILYTQTPMKENCPNLIDTPSFDDKFISYYKDNGYPDYIYFVPAKNAVFISDSFKELLKNQYEVTDTLGYGYCLSRR